MRTLMAFLLVLALAPTAQAAQDTRKDCSIGKIDRIAGGVKVVREGNTVFPLRGEAVCLHDRFMTDARGIAEIKFSDGTELSVGKDSVFVIERWRQRKWFANEAGFELVSGAFRILTGALTQRRHTFEVRTRVATIGVRGTEFWGGLNLTPGELDVIMLKGKGIYVKNDAGQVDINEAGLGTTVRSGQKPSDPATWSKDKIHRAVRTISP